MTNLIITLSNLNLEAPTAEQWFIGTVLGVVLFGVTLATAWWLANR